MPSKALRPCRQPGCPALVEHGYCSEHARPTRERDPRPSSGQRGYNYAWRKRREEHLRIEPNCRVCGAVGTDVDHIVRRRDGGSDEHSNLMTMCHSHHSSKTAKRDGGYGNR